MAVNPDYTKETMAETTHQHANLQQVGYPNYGSQQPVIVTSSPPAYNQPDHVNYPPAEQTCCAPPRQQPTDESNDQGELEDYFRVKPHLKVDFSGVFQEPEEASGAGFITNYNASIYHWTKRCFYIFLACILGPIMAFVFGLVFALMDFLVIWFLNPTVRLIHICTRFASNAFRPLTRVMLDPVFESFGQMFRVRNSGVFTERKYKLDVSGVNFGGSTVSSSSSNEPTHQHSA